MADGVERLIPQLGLGNVAPSLVSHHQHKGHPLAKEQEVSRPGTAPAFSCTSALCVSNPSHPQIHHRSIPGEGIKAGLNQQTDVVTDLLSHGGKGCQHSSHVSKENKL